MKRAVVTGASGFIGRALTKRLLAEGVEVWAVVTAQGKMADITSDRLHETVCDFAHYSELAGLLPKDVDWFIHAAWAGFYGLRSRDLTVQAGNISAAAVALEQAKRTGVKRFLFLGSSYQYRMEPVTENGREVFIRNNIYGIAKEAAERMLRAKAAEYGMAFNSVLFTNVFGVGDRSARSTNTMIRQLLRGEPLRLISGEHLHDWTYIDDAVGGMMAVLERGAAGVEYYIGKHQPETFREIVTRVRDTLAPEAELQFGAYEDRAYIDYTLIDLDALYRDTGFECKADFEECIRKTAAWLLKEDTKMNGTANNMVEITNGGGQCSYYIAACLPAYAVRVREVRQ